MRSVSAGPSTGSAIGSADDFTEVSGKGRGSKPVGDKYAASYRWAARFSARNGVPRGNSHDRSRRRYYGMGDLVNTRGRSLCGKALRLIAVNNNTLTCSRTVESRSLRSGRWRLTSFVASFGGRETAAGPGSCAALPAFAEPCRSCF